MGIKGKRSKSLSSWQRQLENSRIVMVPAEMVGFGEMRTLSPAALGVFMRLLPYAITSKGLPKEMVVIGRLAGLHVLTVRKHWREISALFTKTAAGWELKESPWFSVQMISGDRDNLRHLLPKLIAYWGTACVYCGVEGGPLHIEHIVPVSRGGSDDLTNLTLSCQECNYRKRTKTAAEFGFPLIHETAARIQ